MAELNFRMEICIWDATTVDSVMDSAFTDTSMEMELVMVEIGHLERRRAGAQCTTPMELSTLGTGTGTCATAGVFTFIRTEMNTKDGGITAVEMDEESIAPKPMAKSLWVNGDLGNDTDPECLCERITDLLGTGLMTW